MAKKKERKKAGAVKSFAKKRTANATNSPRVGAGAGDVFDQDMKRRIGHFAGPGEAHMSRKGARGKNH